MYVNDPLSRTLCFGDGKEGMAFEKFSWGNRCSDLSYNLAGNGTFVAGIEVNLIASIVDLGTVFSEQISLARSVNVHGQVAGRTGAVNGSDTRAAVT